MRALPLFLFLGSTLPARAQRPLRSWAAEASVGVQSTIDDDYTSRLEQFGYDAQGWWDASARWALALSWRASRHLELVADLSRLASGEHWRGEDTVGTSFSWHSRALGVLLRAEAPFTNRAVVVPFVEVGPAVAFATTEYSKGADAHHGETQSGRALIAGGGVRFGESGLAGIVLKVRKTWAPALTNLYGEAHDVGGWAFDLGVRVEL